MERCYLIIAARSIELFGCLISLIRPKDYCVIFARRNFSLMQISRLQGSTGIAIRLGFWPKLLQVRNIILSHFDSYIDFVGAIESKSDSVKRAAVKSVPIWIISQTSHTFGSAWRSRVSWPKPLSIRYFTLWSVDFMGRHGGQFNHCYCGEFAQVA